MNTKQTLLTVTALIALFTAPSLAADPCQDLSLNTALNWRHGSMSQLWDCVRQFPLDDSARTGTIDITKRVIEDLYSFGDLAIDSGAPYNIKNDARSRLQALSSKTYSADVDFHIDVANIFYDFKDAHTTYTMPLGYASAYGLSPFVYTSGVDDSGKQYVAVDGVLTYYDTLYTGSTDLFQYAGKKITKVNGQDAMTYFSNLADKGFISKGTAGRFNYGIKAPFSLHPLNQAPTSDSITFQFEGSSSTVTLPYIGVLTEDLDGPGIESLNAPSAKRSAMTTRSPVRKDRKFEFIAMASEDPLLAKYQASQRAQSLKSSFAAGNFELRFLDNSDQTAYGVVDNIPIFILTTMLPEDISSANSVIMNGIKDAKDNGYKTVLIDLRGNGGGYVCWAGDLLRMFVKDFENTEKGDDKGTNAFVDVRKTDFTTHFDSHGWFSSFFADPDTGKELTGSVFADSVTYTRGGKSGQYSKKKFIDCSSWSYMSRVNHEFEDIYLLTDGLCGSACSQFASKLLAFGKAKSIGVGGVVGKSFETSSFCGGNVFQYNPETNKALWNDLTTDSSMKLKNFPTSAAASYNFAESYIPSSEKLPREFNRIDADILINDWNMAPTDLGQYYQNIIDKASISSAPAAAISMTVLILSILAFLFF